MSEDAGGLGRIAAELLHDLAADLDTLRGWSGLVAEGARLSHVAPVDANRLHAETERVGRLVSDLVGWVTRPDPRQRVRPVVQLARTVEWARRREGVVPITLAPTFVSDQAEIAGPPSFFDRIAGNLLRNALRHAHRRVVVSLRGHAHGGRPGVVLRVEDDGPGVPVDLRERLFTPFAHGVASGHGLGLSSTAWLASQLGGLPPRLGTASLGGACFEIWLPIAPASIRPTPMSHATQLTVAILDDDAQVRRIITRFLEHSGIRVIALEPSPEAAEALLSGGVEADLLLLDRQLGVLDGYQLWQELRERRPALAERTALLSGGLRPADAPDALVTLQKPIGREALLAWVAETAPVNPGVEGAG